MDSDKLDLFIEMTNKRFDKFEAKLDLVLNRYNFLYGGMIAISALISLGITIVFGR